MGNKNSRYPKPVIRQWAGANRGVKGFKVDHLATLKSGKILRLISSC